jgi:hypothetical protein
MAKPGGASEMQWIDRITDLAAEDFQDLPGFRLADHLDRWVRKRVPCTDPDCIRCHPPAGAERLIEAASPEYDLFLSYDGDDWEEAKSLAEALQELGLHPWVDRWDLPPGRRWQDVVGRIIERIPVMVVCIGSKGKESSVFQSLEFQAFTQRMNDGEMPLIPVILRSVQGKPDLPTLLSPRTFVDLRESDPDPVQRLYFGITGRKLVALPRQEVPL